MLQYMSTPHATQCLAAAGWCAAVLPSVCAGFSERAGGVAERK